MLSFSELCFLHLLKNKTNQMSCWAVLCLLQQFIIVFLSDELEILPPFNTGSWETTASFNSKRQFPCSERKGKGKVQSVQQQQKKTLYAILTLKAQSLNGREDHNPRIILKARKSNNLK